MEAFVVRWGYLALFAGTFFEGESVLVAAGALAHRGLLSLPLVVLAAWAGSIAGDQFWYQVGRHGGRRFIDRSPRRQAVAASVAGKLARLGALFVFGFRFLYGIRTVTPVLLGTTGYPPLRFLALNVLGTLVWSAVGAGIGWAVGASLSTLLQRAVRIEELVAVLVALALLAWLAAQWARRPRTGSRTEQ